MRSTSYFFSPLGALCTTYGDMCRYAEAGARDADTARAKGWTKAEAAAALDKADVPEWMPRPFFLSPRSGWPYYEAKFWERFDAAW